MDSFSFLVSGTRAQILSTPFSYILYIHVCVCTYVQYVYMYVCMYVKHNRLLKVAVQWPDFMAHIHVCMYVCLAYVI
jgi:hypothetical protein